MNENEFWITVYKLIALVVCTLILIVGGCSIHQQAMVVELVKTGADPIKANCGIMGPQSSNTAAICAQVATKG